MICLVCVLFPLEVLVLSDIWHGGQELRQSSSWVSITTLLQVWRGVRPQHSAHACRPLLQRVNEALITIPDYKICHLSLLLCQPDDCNDSMPSGVMGQIFLMSGSCRGLKRRPGRCGPAQHGRSGGTANPASGDVGLEQAHAEFPGQDQGLLVVHCGDAHHGARLVLQLLTLPDPSPGFMLVAAVAAEPQIVSRRRAPDSPCPRSGARRPSCAARPGPGAAARLRGRGHG